MPEFVLQLEHMSGLPAWSLLLIAALVLLVFALAVSLSQASRRAAAVALQDNLNTLRKDVPDAVDPLDPTAAAAVADERDGKQLAGAPAEAVEEPVEVDIDEPANDGYAEPDELGEPSEAVNEPAEDEDVEPDNPAEDELAEPAEADGDAASDEGEHVADFAQPEEPELVEEFEGFAEPDSEDDANETEGADCLLEHEAEVSEPAKGGAHHAWNVEETEPVVAAWDVNDREIAKAAAGEHGRFGQSPFGIDFGFLEEYEEQYETALTEFQRLREKYRSQS